jgi:putative tricarboxylic transport membrane protein
MFAVYAVLTGQKKASSVVALSAILITLGIYFVFQRGLGIMLPRGYGFLRDIALFLESL